MMQVVTYAVLIVLVLEAPTVLAQGKEEYSSRYGEALPWIAHFSTEGFYLEHQASGEVSGKWAVHNQAGIYEGFTLQPYRFAWFHLGIKSKWTDLEGMRESFKEPFSLKVSGTAEIVQGLAYLSFGMHAPFFSDQASLADSASFYNIFNSYFPHPDPNISPWQILYGGLHLARKGEKRNFLTGLSVMRPGSSKLYEEYRFQPAATATFSLRLRLQHKKSFSQFDSRSTFYGMERDPYQGDAHKEGFFLQARYGYRRIAGKHGIEVAGGGSFKDSDGNRVYKVPGDPPKAEVNENLQRAYAELHWESGLWKNFSTLVYIMPQVLMDNSGWDGSGWQADGGFVGKFRLGNMQFLRIRTRLTYGMFRGIWRGAGISIDYSFQQVGSDKWEFPPVEQAP